MHRPTMIKIKLYTVYYCKSTMVSTPLTASCILERLRVKLHEFHFEADELHFEADESMNRLIQTTCL